MKLLNANIPQALRKPGKGLVDCLQAFERAHAINRVVLFGSYARGDARSDSDVDLCIVAEGVENQLDAARDFRRAIRDIHPKPALTLIPITPARLDEKTKSGDYFYNTIMKEGLCVAQKD